jgi:hypothetical protein
MCLRDGPCAEDYEFFYITSADEEVEIDGVLGITPTSPEDTLTFSNYLLDRGLIEENYVSIYSGKKFGNITQLTFGGYEPSLLDDFDSYPIKSTRFVSINTTYSIAGKKFWTITTDDLKFIDYKKGDFKIDEDISPG